MFRGKAPTFRAFATRSQLLAQKYGGEVLAIWNSLSTGRLTFPIIDTHYGLVEEMSHACSSVDVHMEIPSRILPRIILKWLRVLSNVRVAAFKIKEKETYGIQFHRGDRIQAKAKISFGTFALISVDALRIGLSDVIYRCFNSRFESETLELNKVVMGHLEGVDSSVCGYLDPHVRLVTIWSAYFVDNGCS